MLRNLPVVENLLRTIDMETARPISRVDWKAIASADPSAELEDEGDPMDLDEKNPEDIPKYSTLILCICSTRSDRLRGAAAANKRKFPPSLSDPFAAPRPLQPIWQHVEREAVEQILSKRKRGNDGPDFHIEGCFAKRGGKCQDKHKVASCLDFDERKEVSGLEGESSGHGLCSEASGRDE
jgi:hypothetical protein